MAINLENSNLATRENRIGSITGYVGSLKDLATQSECGTLKGCSRCFSQSSTCLSMCGLSQLAAIRDVAIIHHGPAGCSVTAAGSYYMSKVMSKKRGVTSNTVYVGTDMNENDTIFGSTETLRKIILEVNKRYSPKAIFVASACATGIIGEDIDSIVDSVRDEVGVPIVAVHCEGFKSRIWATGFDISDHAVLQEIVQPPREGVKTNKINFKNFFESARPEIIEMFKNFDLEPVFLYCNSTVEELSHISESVATTCICGTLGNYLGNALEEKYGVPYVRSINQCGIVGFETWLREIGRVTGRSDKIEKYIEEQRAIYIPQIEEVKKELKGLTAVIGMGPGYTFEVSRVLDELGI
ncbi:MAG TPA: nitrogenase, partial [Lachnospiraceae bacterium]|nr:nitrogenase [Lachnospiraceae bacterium]